MTEGTKSQEPLRRSSQILIDEPPINTDPYSDFSSRDPQLANEMLKGLSKAEITPEDYPLAIDLFAGQGPIGAKLIEHGWSPENCWNIDIRRPRKPREGTNWVYADLKYLVLALINQQPLPEEIEGLRSKFDLVTVFFSVRNCADLFILGDFFLRRGGIIWAEAYDPPDELKDKWESTKSELIYRKK